VRHNDVSNQDGRWLVERDLEEQKCALEVLDAIAVVTEWRRDQEICSQESAPDHWYRVLSGAVRECTLRVNGQRHVIDLLLTGDFFGFSSADRHCSAAQAVTDGTKTACYARNRVEALADVNRPVARLVREQAFKAIDRLQEQLIVVNHTRAIEKVGALLIKLTKRLPDKHGDVLALPISRYDIADYLGISVETVSRSISYLKQEGLIALRGTRNISIKNRHALEEEVGDYCDEEWVVAAPAELPSASSAEAPYGMPGRISRFCPSAGLGPTSPAVLRRPD
jgi:CRP-like cAMP-binding protein